MEIIDFATRTGCRSSTENACCKRRDPLDEIRDLVWKNPKGYFLLLLSCLLDIPVSDRKQFIKLNRAGLIDDGGYPPKNIKNILKKVALNR